MPSAAGCNGVQANPDAGRKMPDYVASRCPGATGTGAGPGREPARPQGERRAATLQILFALRSGLSIPQTHRVGIFEELAVVLYGTDGHYRQHYGDEREAQWPVDAAGSSRGFAQ